MKTCSVCKTRKDRTEFYKMHTTKDGLLPRCKDCHKAYYTKRRDAARAVREADREEKLASGNKECTKCGASKPYSEFYKQFNGFAGLRGDCKKCVRAKQKQSLQDPERKARKAKQDKEYSNRPEVRSLINKRAREKYANDEEYRRSRSEYARELHKRTYVKKGRGRLPEEYRAYEKNGVMVKKCSKCDTTRNTSDFYANKGSADGRQGSCKPCYVAARNEYSKSNREKVNKYARERKKRDAAYHLVCTVRSVVNRAISSRGRKFKKRTFELVGCHPKELMAYLEAQFKPGMTWENYGRETWHIDHIRPLAHFDLRKLSEQKKAFHYTNLQPLYAEENMKKGARFVG